MRLREKDLRTVYLKGRKVEVDGEAEETVSYPFPPKKIRMNIQSVSDTTEIRIYGSDIQKMKSGMYQGNLIHEGHNELDGLCVYVDKDEEPDFIIKSIQAFSNHKKIILERCGRDES